MANTNNMNNTNNFVNFSDSVMNIMTKSLPNIIAISQSGNMIGREEQAIEFSNQFDKIIQKYGNLEKLFFPCLKDREERKINGKTESYYDFWFVALTQMISSGFNQQIMLNHQSTNDNFGELFNRLIMYMSVTRNLDPEGQLLQSLLDGSDIPEDERLIVYFLLRCKPTVTDIFKNNTEDVMIKYLDDSLVQCIVNDQTSIGPAVDSVSMRTGQEKYRCIADISSMLVFLSFVDDLMIKLTGKETDIITSLASGEDGQAYNDETAKSKIKAAEAVSIAATARISIRKKFEEREVTQETKELFGEVFSF